MRWRRRWFWFWLVGLLGLATCRHQAAARPDTQVHQLTTVDGAYAQDGELIYVWTASSDSKGVAKALKEIGCGSRSTCTVEWRGVVNIVRPTAKGTK